MKNICKQLFLKIRYTEAYIKALTVFLLISLTTIISGAASIKGNTLDEFLGSFDTCTIFGTIIIISFISLTLGSEFNNKTIYYLVMNGNSRKEVFIGKFIGYLPYTVFLGVLQSLILYGTLAFMTSADFWNQNINHVFLNSLAFTTIYVSYFALSLSFCFLTGSTVGGIGGSLITMVVFNVIYLLLDLFGISLYSFDISQLSGMFLFRFLLQNHTDNLFQFAVIFVYTLLSVFYLLTGYHVFKKKDLV